MVRGEPPVAVTGRRGLIKLEGVKELIARKTPFEVRYEPADDAMDGLHGTPKYHCIYRFAEEGAGFDEYVLVSTRFGPGGPEPRALSLWPGLLRHHVSLHPERDLCLSGDWSLRVLEPKGARTPKGRRRKA